MLTITIPGAEYYDEVKDEIVSFDDKTIKLEHSLLSISKWEAKWHKPFLSSENKTPDETIDYVRCMSLTPSIDDFIFERLTQENVKAVNDYISDSMTATTFKKKEGKGSSRDIVTSELIYYWMVSLQIPFECEKWHLNRLLTLIKVCDVKNSPKKKMSKSDIMRQNASLNAARRNAAHTKG